MDMKKILQAFDGAATKPVQGASDMKKFISIIRESANPYTPVEENVITSFEEGSVGGDANAFLIAADNINDEVMGQIDKIKINADPQLLKNLMAKFNEFMSAYHAVGKEILQPDMFDELPGDATSTDNTDESVAEGWGAEKQQRDLDAANKQRAAEYKEVIARHKDDPEFLDYLRMFLINNWGGLKAEKGAEEWIAKGKPLPEWFVKMKQENPEKINSIFDRIGMAEGSSNVRYKAHPTKKTHIVVTQVPAGHKGIKVGDEIARSDIKGWKGFSAERKNKGVAEGLSFKDYVNLQEAKKGLQ